VYVTARERECETVQMKRKRGDERGTTIDRKNERKQERERERKCERGEREGAEGGRDERNCACRCMGVCTSKKCV